MSTFAPKIRTAFKFYLETRLIQISTLIYCIGKQPENVLKTVTFSEKEDKNDFETVMIKFDAHFMPKNTTQEKTMFDLRVQGDGESVTIFARTLMNLQLLVNSLIRAKK